MRQVHKAGEKLFVDYAGQQPHLVDAATGEVIDGRALRRGARRVELHLRRGDAHAAERRLHREPHPRALEYFGGVPARRGPRPTARPASAMPCRYEPGVQRSYADWAQPLRHGVMPARPAQAAGQGEGRSRRAGRRALDPGAAAPRDLLHARGAERADRELLDDAQRAPDEGLRRPVAARALRALRPSGAAAAAGRPLRLRRVEPGARQHRLPRRGRRTTSTRCRTRSSTSVVEVCAHRDDRRDLSARQARLARICAAPRAGGYTDRPRAHAEGAPGASRMDARRA